MKAKRLLSLLLTAALMLSMMTPVLAASAETELPRASQTRLEETNEVVSIRLQATGKLVYGSPFELSVVTRPADAQYIGVVLGIKGEAKGYVTLVLSDKLRTLLKMIPLPRKMSKTPDQVEEFNVYAYVKQLIDGNDVSVLLGVADEVVKVMDTLKFYIPTLKDMSMGLKLSLELIRRYLPEGAFSRIYLDEQPVDSGSYVAGAVALESGDLNTAGVAMFKIKPKTEGVRLYWAEDLPAGMTLAEAEAHNVGALLESDGVVVDNAKVTCTYKKKGLFSSKSTEFPTQPGIYTQTATVSGNYSCEKITRTIVINKHQKKPHPCVSTGGFFLSYLHPEPPAPAAATAAVAEQIEQDHAPAPAHQPAGLGVGGLGAVGLAGILHPAQVHLVLGVIGVQLNGAAGVLQRIDAVAEALIGQRGEVVPPCRAVVHAVQHPAGLSVAAIGYKVAGRLHLGAVRAGVAGSALLLVAAKTEPETKRVEPEAEIALLPAVLAVALVVSLLVAALIITLLAVAVTAAGLSAHLGAGVALGDGVVSCLHLFEVLFGGGVVGVQVGVPALALGTVGFLYLVVGCAALDAQHLIGISHGSTSSRLSGHARPFRSIQYYSLQDSACKIKTKSAFWAELVTFSEPLWPVCSCI